MKTTRILLKKNRVVCLMLIVLVLTVFCESGKASSIIANFTDGAGQDTPDQYPGLFGGSGAGGWLTAWTTSLGGSGGAVNAGINSLLPLTSGGGNYLSFSGATSSTTSNAYLGIYRQHDTSVVNLSQQLTYTFDYRIDYAASVDSQYSIFSSTTADNATNGNNTWVISSTLSNGWQVRGLSATGNTIVVGDTYHFVINVNPATMSYTVSITNLSNLSETPYTSGTATFRNQVTSDGSYLCFVIKDEQKLSSDTFGFSIDNLSITSIPELPTSAYVLMLGAVFCGIAYFRSKFKISYLS